MNAISRTRLQISTGILLASCFGAAGNSWSGCPDSIPESTDCGSPEFFSSDTDLRFKLELATLPGSDLAALPDSALAFDDLRFQFPENPAIFQTNEAEPNGPAAAPDPWDGPANEGFALFIGNVARLQSDGSLSLGTGRPDDELEETTQGNSGDLDVDLGLSYGGTGGFSSSFGLAEKVGNYDADPGVVGQFRYRF
ncbi:MAG: hypothetical protein ACR2QB_04745 [Gammaproteobacteria bacterium]